MQLLAQLTVVGDVTREAFAARCAELAAGPEHVLVVEGASHERPADCVLLFFRLRSSTPLRPHVSDWTPPHKRTDGPTGPLLACGTLVLERKLIRACGTCGHVEDVVVDASARGRGVGKLLLAALTELARQKGCYKVILDCSDDNVAFYTRCGFKRKEVQMALYF